MSLDDISLCFGGGFVLALVAYYLGTAYWAMRSAALGVVD